MSVASLHAVANWNADRGCALFRQHHFEKNNDRCAAMLGEAVRYLHNADSCRRQAWMMEHSSAIRRRRGK